MKKRDLFSCFSCVIPTILAVQSLGITDVVAQFQSVSRFDGDAGQPTEVSGPASRGSISDEPKPVQMSLRDDPASLPVAVAPVSAYGLQPLQQFQSRPVLPSATPSVPKLQFGELQKYLSTAPTVEETASYPDVFAASSYRAPATQPMQVASAPNSTQVQFAGIQRYLTDAGTEQQQAGVNPVPFATAGYGSFAVQPVNVAMFRAQAAPMVSNRFGELSASPKEGSLATVARASSTTSGVMEDRSRYSTQMTAKTWASPDLFWQPLYFEETAAERYGHHCGIFQPAVSGTQFLKNVVFLPYKVASHPPFESEYGLGHDRPGNCVEPYRELPEINARGIVGQGLVIGGLAFGL
jgi:hypothetical protein